MSPPSPLGWSTYFEDQLPPSLPDGTRVARVVARGRDRFRLRDLSGDDHLAHLARHLIGEGDEPTRAVVVGDWVLADLLGDPPAPGAPWPSRLHRVLERRTALTRTAAGTTGLPQLMAANVDRALVVTSANEELEPRRLERYLTLLWEASVPPAVVLTKVDEAENPVALVASVSAVAPGVPVLPVCAPEGQGLEAVRRLLAPGETAILLGSSGVGKSTLANALLGDARLATAAVRARDARGRHTTTGRHLLELPGGALLVDTPGMRELGLAAAGEGGLDRAFAEIADLVTRCRFRDCAHRSEPGCAVQEALDEGTLDPARLESYEKLQRELAYRAAREERRERKARQRERRR